MSTPIATAADLGVYLNDPAIDTVRATLMIDLVQGEAETYVLPLPTAARGRVLAAAGRAYTNATSAHDVALGTGHIGYGAPSSQTGVGGLYLSRSDIRALRRMAGRTGAFVIDLMPIGVSEVQSLVVVATAGTFLLRFNGANSAALAFNITAPALQSALESIQMIGLGNITVTSTVAGTYTLTFQGRLATTPVPDFIPDVTALTGTATIAVVTAGVYRPGQSMPWWDWQ